MTTVKSDSRLGRLRRSRVALALSHAIFHSQYVELRCSNTRLDTFRTRPQVVPFGARKHSDSVLEDYFDTLLKQEGCQAAWDAYTNVTTGFPLQLARGTAPLNGFRHYTLQDAIYLEYYVRVRMEAIGTWDSAVSSQDLWDFVATIPDGLSYSKATRSICENQLGIPGSVIDDEWKNHKSTELQTSIRNYETVMVNAIQDRDNSWLDIHFALLPCIKGYYTITKALLQDTTTIRNTLYYSLWIEANADETYVDEYDTFIKNNIGTPTSEQWAHWGEIFKQACNNELSFFNLAIKNYPQYDILSAGKYTIQPFVYSTDFLAVDSHGGVVVSSESTQWELINSKLGYAVKLADNKYLGFDGQQVLIQSETSTTWTINPVSIPDNNTYQLFLSGAIQSALDVDSNKKVSVAKNDATTQTWKLKLA